MYSSITFFVPVVAGDDLSWPRCNRIRGEPVNSEESLAAGRKSVGPRHPGSTRPERRRLAFGQWYFLSLLKLKPTISIAYHFLSLKHYWNWNQQSVAYHFLSLKHYWNWNQQSVAYHFLSLKHYWNWNQQSVAYHFLSLKHYWNWNHKGNSNNLAYTTPYYYDFMTLLLSDEII